ncbi:trigger factor [bacterium]|nr:trigger factor [bacterium]
MPIKAKVRTKTPCEIVLDVEVPQEDLRASYEKTVSRIGRYAEVPGFRAGKAPRELIEQRFQRELRASTLEDLVVGVIRSVIKKHNLDAVTGPRLPKDPEFPDSGPLAFTAEFEVAPAVTLKNYKGLPLVKRKVAITDEDVNRTIDQLLDQHATFEDIAEDRPTAFGDWVVVDYTGSLGGQQKLKRDGAWIELSSTFRMPVPGFADQLVGMKKGESRDFSVSAPTDFYMKEAAGMLIDFHATVQKILERRKPELTDELAKQIDPQCNTVADLRSAIGKNQEKYREYEEQRRMRDLAREALVKNHPLPLPPALVGGRVRRILEEEVRNRMRQGETEEQIKAAMPELQKQATAAAEVELRGEYILEAIARAENITASDADIQPQLQYYAQAFHRTIDNVRKSFARDGYLDTLYQTARENKALDLVVKEAKIAEQ